MITAKTHALRRSRAPEENARLSGVVYVLDESGRGYSYIRFAQSLVTALGRKMPRGLSMDSPGYLKLMYVSSTNTWRFFCMYAGPEEEGVFLGEYRQKPEWLGRIWRLSK